MVYCWILIFFGLVLFIFKLCVVFLWVLIVSLVVFIKIVEKYFKVVFVFNIFIGIYFWF